MIYPIPDSPFQATILKILLHKIQEVAQIQQEKSIASLYHLSETRTVRDLPTALQQNASRPSIIAHIKKASPIHGIIRPNFDAVAIAKAYEHGGAACLAVYTDQRYFQGSYESLRNIRRQIKLPILSKDFILYACQVYLARKAGADAVLLIAAILLDRQLQNLSQLIQGLGMSSVIEVHTLAELDRVLKIKGINLIVINNQRLLNLNIDISTSQQIIAARRSQLEELGIIVISESGLYTPADLSFVAEAGTDAVILGDSLIKEENLEQAVRSLLITRKELVKRGARG